MQTYESMVSTRCRSTACSKHSLLRSVRSFFLYLLPELTTYRTENTPLIREPRRVHVARPSRRNRRTKRSEQGLTAKEVRQIAIGLLIILGLAIIAAAVIVPTVFAIDYKDKLDKALKPDSIRLRNERWAKEEQDHEDIKVLWAKEESRLRDAYKRSETEWGHKTESLRKEHNRLKDIWTKAHEEYLRDQKQWEAERKAEEKRRKENERRRLGITWESPFAHECTSYGTRPYNAKLMNVPPGFDAIEACGEMPIVFHDRTVEKPLWCERLVRIIIFIFELTGCELRSDSLSRMVTCMGTG